MTEKKVATTSKQPEHDISKLKPGSNVADAKKVGIERFRMMPAVGDSPIFIEALRELVLQAAGVEAAPKGFRPLAAQAPNLFVN